MKIALAQLNYHIGNFASNEQKILLNIEKAQSQGADLIIFSELAISGYPPRDFLEFNDFIDKCWASTEKIAESCKNIAVIMGLPTRNHADKGKPLFNSAAFIEDGKIKDIKHKSLLPNYDIFDEYRYFEPNSEFSCIDFKGEKIALTICEDLWNIGDVPLYTINPMDELVKEHPDVMINIAASPFHFDQREVRKDILKRNVEKYKIPLLYVNHVGAQTELLFDGGSLVMNEKAEIVGEMSYFEEDFQLFDTQKLSSTPVETCQTSKIELIHDALVMGIRNYFEKLGFKKALLGLSGGIDSAVTLVLAVKALGAENVTSILLPSQYSSDHSVKDAEDLAKNLGSPYDIIPIKNIYNAFEKELEEQFKGLPFGIAEENIQARSRGVLLMALSNKFGSILLNTSNKSEAAVGYGTLYGDMNGGLSVLGDVYKIDVFELARFMNKDEEVIPWNTITKPPSAELRPDQKDSDSLPDYEILDEILFQYIEKRKGPQELIGMGFEEALVHRILRLVNLNEYKRYQTSPVLRVSSKAFGMGRRIPIVAKYLS
ncbi:NAD+ synthase [Lentimicrobium sp. S6]|uniref:NAD+ synthase n=1 Tax=Lentimicrobium sp. S6 TaxID=2735872 RepID=UPI001552D576|nr:NAD+ synthase [Lentimicrobium sp. S6]NPD44880.1 NAD+ synthase [Lentimicrobium sp. S6]